MVDRDHNDGASLTPEVIVITGLSGAGRSTAAKVLEDLDWFVVDNLPPELLPTMADLVRRTQGEVRRIAVVVDVRGRAFFAALAESLEQLRAQGIDPSILFLEADDGVLVRRFDGVRRRHPLQGDGRVTEGIAAERQVLAELRGTADLIVNTTELNVHQLRRALERAFAPGNVGDIHVGVLSFGYKYGLPVDADLVVDCRFLPNPHWVPELRPGSGLDPEVSNFVLSQPGAKEFIERYVSMLEVVLRGYRAEGKHFVTLAVGCTGGRHRSVAVAERLAMELSAGDLEIDVSHRDLGRG